jgi:hypothetical protein
VNLKNLTYRCWFLNCSVQISVCSIWCTRKKIITSQKVFKGLCFMKNTAGDSKSLSCKVSLRWFIKRCTKLVPPSLQGCLIKYNIMPSKLRSLVATTQEDSELKKKRPVIAVQLIHHLPSCFCAESIHKGRWLIILVRKCGEKIADLLEIQNIYTVVHGGVWTFKIDYFMLLYLN